MWHSLTWIFLFILFNFITISGEKEKFFFVFCKCITCQWFRYVKNILFSVL